MSEHPDFSSLVDSYRSMYKEFGYSPKSLGWNNGKQFLRFHQLTSSWKLENTSWLDVGCGFGDFIKFLYTSKVNIFDYTGVDIVPEFINFAKNYYQESNCKFVNKAFLEGTFNSTYDYVFASGTFNSKFHGRNGYKYIEENMVKMFDLSKKAIAIDFLSDRVDYKHEHNFNSNPEKILSLAYKLSKRVVLRNDYFPFEFAVIIYKEDTVYSKLTMYSEIHREMSHLL
jgi:SAM-dependent methyltransferase